MCVLCTYHFIHPTKLKCYSIKLGDPDIWCIDIFNVSSVLVLVLHSRPYQGIEINFVNNWRAAADWGLINGGHSFSIIKLNCLLTLSATRKMYLMFRISDIIIVQLKIFLCRKKISSVQIIFIKIFTAPCPRRWSWSRVAGPGCSWGAAPGTRLSWPPNLGTEKLTAV